MHREKPGFLLLTALAVALMALIVFAGCNDDNTCAVVPTAGYVGTATCGQSGCHQDIHDTFMKSGHPYKFTFIEDGQAPTYPWDNLHAGGIAVAGPPGGAPWSDYAGVIGGFGWKARWVKNDGHIHTGPAVQYNFETQGWVAYEDGVDKVYNYSCFKCHTTGADPAGEWKPGVAGTFEFGGIQCEECHGPGAQHASDPSSFEMNIDDSSEQCGRCHTRDSARRIAASGGYVKHHEQFDEWLHSPHSGKVGCNDCHDAHASVIFDEQAPGQGVTKECTDCHEATYASGGTENAHIAGPECTDCHMPEAAKSAVASNLYNGDISSHILRINTDAVGKAAMWTPDGKFVATDENSQARLTLDFTCYGCHKDEQGVGGPMSQKTLAELSAKATGIHDGVTLKADLRK